MKPILLLTLLASISPRSSAIRSQPLKTSISSGLHLHPGDRDLESAAVAQSRRLEAMLLPDYIEQEKLSRPAISSRRI
jgi:hypothetical protein